MAIDEAAQSSTPEDDITEKAHADDAAADDNAVVGDDNAVNPWTWYLWIFFFFLVACHVLGFL